MKLPNKIYDVLKWLVILFIPALAVFYGKLATIWDLPFIDEIPDTLIGLDAFLGAILGLSTMSYEADKKTQLQKARELNGQNGGD